MYAEERTLIRWFTICISHKLSVIDPKKGNAQVSAMSVSVSRRIRLSPGCWHPLASLWTYWFGGCEIWYHRTPVNIIGHLVYKTAWLNCSRTVLMSSFKKMVCTGWKGWLERFSFYSGHVQCNPLPNLSVSRALATWWSHRSVFHSGENTCHRRQRGSGQSILAAILYFRSATPTNPSATTANHRTINAFAQPRN